MFKLVLTNWLAYISSSSSSSSSSSNIIIISSSSSSSNTNMWTSDSPRATTALRRC